MHPDGPQCHVSEQSLDLFGWLFASKQKADGADSFENLKSRFYF